MTEVEPTIVSGGPSVEESPVVGSSPVERPAGESRPLAERSPEQQPAHSTVSEGSGVCAAAVAEPVLELSWQGAAEEFPPAEAPESVVQPTPKSESQTDGQEVTAGDRTAPAPTPDSTAATGARAAPVQSLRSLIESELVTLDRYHRLLMDSGEADAIHKMRVITRKLQAAIDLLEFKPDQLKIRGIKKKLRGWRRSLSRVRNYDVFLKIVDKETQSRRPGGRRPYELIGTELERRRVKNLRRARSELQHVKIDELAARLGIELGRSSPPESGQPGPGGEVSVPGKAGPALIDDETKIAARAFDRLRQRLAEFQAKALSTHATDRPAEIHELRIAAKRLRYLVEALSQMGYGDSVRAVEWLKSIQDRLGELNDIEAFGDEVVRIAARPGFVRKHMAEAGEMLQAASRFLARRESLRARLLPVRVPSVLGAASSRLTRSVSAGPAAREGE